MEPSALELIHAAGIEVERSEAVRTASGEDFGALVRGPVLARVRPSTAQQVRELVQIASEHGLSLAARGLGNSQSGQSIPVDGLSVDMTAFDKVQVTPHLQLARCGAGATWREVLLETSKHGLAPQVLPLNLELTVGGVLSAGGMGSTSHRFGMACSTVAAFAVVTGTGEMLEVTEHEHRDAYDCVLGGVGQFGVLTHATLRLRPLKSHTRTAYLLYDDLESMAADQLRLMDDPRCIHLEGFASAAVQGVRRVDGRRMPFARWFYGLHVSVEDTEPGSCALDALVAGLNPRECVHVEDSDSLEYASRYDIRFQIMRATGAWTQIHPWLECTLPRATAVALISETIPGLPLALGDGHRIMPVADVPRPRFLKIASDGPALGLTVLPMGVAPPFEGAVLSALEQTHARLTAAGGKRYLSGWSFEPDEAAWKQHFGDDYDDHLACKRRFDPHGIFRSLLRG